MEEIGGKGLELLGRLHQPAQYGIGVDLKNARRPSNAESLSQAADDMDDEVRRRAFAMKDRALRLACFI